MASLTGTKVSDTYQQLLKLTSQGVDADASGKYVEDGLGTDTALSLSTTRVGIGTASVSSDAALGVSGNIELKNAGDKYWIPRQSDGALTGSIYSRTGSNVTISGAGSSSGQIEFIPSSANSSAVSMTIDSSQRVGIGTTDNFSAYNGSSSSSASNVTIKGSLRLDSESTSTGAGTELDSIQFGKAHQLGAGVARYAMAEIRSFTNGGYEGGLNFHTSFSVGGGGYDLSKALSIAGSGALSVFAHTGEDTSMKFISDRSSDGQLIHTTSFNADNSASQETTYADMRVNIVDNSDATEDGSITFRTMKAGTMTEHITLESDGPVKSVGGIYFTGNSLAGADTGISSSGHGGDLRFYANGTNWASLTSAGKMGIRTTSPNVGGFTDARGVLTISSEDNAGANNYAVLELQGHSINSSGVNGLIMFLDHTTENARIQSQRTDSASYGDLRFFTKGGGDLEEHMRIRASGNIWIQNGSDFRTTTHGSVDRIGSVDIRDESGYNPTLHVMSDRADPDFSPLRLTGGHDNPSSASQCIWIDFHDGDGNHRGGIQNGSTPDNPEFFNGGSDERIKTNIVDTATNGLKIINGLELKDFTVQEWYNGYSTDVTCDFVAQNAEEHFPAMVSEHKMKPKREEFRQDFVNAGLEAVEVETALGTEEMFPVKCISHGALIPILVKALQEADDKIDALTAKVELLTERLNDLEPEEPEQEQSPTVKERVNSLEARVNDLENG